MRLVLPLAIAAALTMIGCRPRSYNSNASSVSGNVVAQFPSQDGAKESFFFGLATAPAHVEDKLNDAWADFADNGKVSSFKNQAIPHERLRFWSDYKTEIDVAASTGVRVFRMGLDWGRLVPNKPDYPSCSTTGGIQDKEALRHYVEIVDYARSKNLQIMMTLFHHSAPKWFINAGGWPVDAARDCFVRFSKDVVDTFQDKVAYWLTFNEPAVYNMFTYVAGMWPPGKVMQNPAEMFAIPGTFRGALIAANENMSVAHAEIYKYIHEGKKLQTQVGIAHNVGWYKATTGLDAPSAIFTSLLMNDMFMDLVAPSMDFIGLNYYGAEYVAGTSVSFRSRSGVQRFWPRSGSLRILFAPQSLSRALQRVVR
jgi:beta-glucosidase/6-phospho-beta-glucosidase/beta-galactosidase